MSVVRVLYQVVSTPEDVERQARAMALEQTVEVPEEVITNTTIRDRVIAVVESVVEAPEDRSPPGEGSRLFRVAIVYDADLTSFQIPQLLNLIYGNISIHSGIRILRVDLPSVLLEAWNPPCAGTALPGLSTC